MEDWGLADSLQILSKHEIPQMKLSYAFTFSQSRFVSCPPQRFAQAGEMEPLEGRKSAAALIFLVEAAI